MALFDFRHELNPQQLAAATAPGGPMLIVAGAGTGKTRTLTCRLAFLVESGIDPANILLMTFTNRAAQEMMERAADTVGRDIHELMGGTFHHIANVFLRRYGHGLDIDPGFSIIDREDTKALLRVCARELGFDKIRNFPNNGALAGISGFVQNTLAPLGQVLLNRYPMLMEHHDAINAVLELYHARKTEANVLDFDDLLTRFLQLLDDFDDVRHRLATRFEHILVDEFQDTNAVQARIVDSLASKHRNICVVGDDAQSIYGFRGADIDNILGFQQRYPDATIYRLESNYRSLPGILDLANENIRQNLSRIPKNLVSTREAPGMPAIVPILDGGEQATFIADRIEKLCENAHLALSEIAVLYRSHFHSLEIQVELQRRGIPFQVRGGLRFFEQAHVKDIVAFLRIKHNPLDQPAWLRILPMIQGVGQRTAEKFWNAISGHSAPLTFAGTDEAQQLLPTKAKAEFANFANALRTIDGTDDVAVIVDAVIKGFYRAYLQSNYTFPLRREEDIKAVVGQAEQYADLGDFLSEIALAADFSGDSDVPPDEVEKKNVVLSTIHQAKGLEWPVVFIPWLNETRFPTSHRNEEDDNVEEERRIFHVAITRSRDQLFLCVPKRLRGKDGASTPLKPSRFIVELNPELMNSHWQAMMEIEAASYPAGSRLAASLRQPRQPGWGTSPRIQDHQDDPVYDYDD